MLAPDRKFALSSRHEAKKLYLEQAKAVGSSPSRLLSDVVRKKA
jgi:hypothetical protein